MVPAMRMPYGESQAYLPPVSSFHHYNQFEYPHNGPNMNNGFGEDLAPYTHQWPQNLPAAPAGALGFSTAADQGFDTAEDDAEDDTPFDQDYLHVVPNNTSSQLDYTAYKHLKPAQIAEIFDGRSPAFAAYPLPIHHNVAQAMLHLPLAGVPTHSLLAPSREVIIMEEFPPPWEPIPNDVTLLEILRGWMNHLWYEGLDCFIQIGSSPKDLVAFMTPELWDLLKKHKISIKSEEGKNSNWIAKRLASRKQVLGQAYVDALIAAPRLREAGAAFGSNSKNIAPPLDKKPRKPIIRQASTAEESEGEEPDEEITAQRKTITPKPRLPVSNAVKVTSMAAPDIVTKASARAAVTIKHPSSSHPAFRTRLMTSTSATNMTSTSCAPSTKAPKRVPSDPPSMTTPDSQTTREEIFNFFVENISAWSSPLKPEGFFFYMTFWDGPEQYEKAKKEFSARTQGCLILAGKMIATDPVLSTADTRYRFDCMLALVGHDIFTRQIEFSVFHAEELARTSGKGDSVGIRTAFDTAFRWVMPFCMSDAIGCEVYNILVNEVGYRMADYRDADIITFPLLVKARTAAIAYVTKTQQAVYERLRHHRELQKKDPDGFKVQDLFPNASLPSRIAVPEAFGTSAGPSNKLMAPVGSNQHGLPLDGCSGSILGSADSDTEMYLVEDVSPPASNPYQHAMKNAVMAQLLAPDDFQAHPSFGVASTLGVKRTLFPKATDDVFYDGNKGEPNKKKAKSAASNTGYGDLADLGGAFTDKKKGSVEQGPSRVNSLTMATTNSGVNATYNSVQPPPQTFPTSSHSRDVDALEALERQAGVGHREAPFGIDTILFTQDIPEIDYDGETSYVEKLEEHYRGGEPGIEEQWTW